MTTQTTKPTAGRPRRARSRRFYLLWALTLLILLALAFYRDTCQEIGGDCEEAIVMHSAKPGSLP